MEAGNFNLEDESEESFEENLAQMREELVERSVSIRMKHLGKEFGKRTYLHV